MIVQVNGHRLYYQTRGRNGAPWVVLLHHGLGATLSWRKQIDPLLAAGYRLLLYDRWGYGKSEPRPALDVPVFEHDIEDLRALLEGLGIQRAALVGHSDGGTISLSFAARYPDRVNAVVTVAAHIYLEEKMLPGIESIEARFANQPRLREGLIRLHGDKAAQVVENWVRAWREPHLREWDMRPLLSDVSAPTWVVQGDADEYATPRHAQDIAAGLPDADLWLPEGCPHMLPQVCAEAFNQRLTEFLLRTVPLPSSSRAEFPQRILKGQD